MLPFSLLTQPVCLTNHVVLVPFEEEIAWNLWRCRFDFSIEITITLAVKIAMIFNTATSAKQQYHDKCDIKNQRILSKNVKDRRISLVKVK